MKIIRLLFLFILFTVLMLPLIPCAELNIIPNPFNSDSETATIIYTPSKPSDVTIGIFDSNGNLTRRLFAGKVTETKEIIWDGKGDYNNPLPHGSYTVKAQSNQKISLSVEYSSHIHYGTDTAYMGNLNAVAIANHFGHQVEIFDYQGSLIGRFGTFGFRNNQLYFPYGIAFDKDKRILFVSDSTGTIRSLDLSIPLNSVSEDDFCIFYRNDLYPSAQGLDVFDSHLYAAMNGAVLKLDYDGNEVGSTGNLGNIPDVCAALPEGSTANQVYFINNSSGPNPGLYRIDESIGFNKNIFQINAGTLTDPDAKWKSISYDHGRDVIYLLYTNSTKKSFGIRTIDALLETVIDEFEILEISTTGHSLAVMDSSAINLLLPARVFVSGINVCNRFLYYTNTGPGNGSLNLDSSFGNLFFFFLWLGDIEAVLEDYIFTADRGIYPDPKPNLYGLIDFESVNLFGRTFSYNIGSWGIAADNLFEPRGTGILYNYHDNQVQFYIVNRSTEIYPNYGKIFRLEQTSYGYDTAEYYSGLSNPVGMDAFYAWLLTIENDPGNKSSRIIMIDTYINSPASAIPTEFAVSEYRTELNDPIDLAMDYQGRIYVLNRDSAFLFFLNTETVNIDFICELQGVSEIQNKDFGGIAVDSFGKIYIANNAEGNIYIFNPQGQIVRTIGNGKGWKRNEFNRIEGMDFDPDGNLWVSDSGNHRYQQIIFFYEGVEQKIVTITDNVGMPYVSLFSLSKKEPVIAGELEMYISFSEAMDTSYPPEVYFIDKEFGNIHTVTQKSFSQNLWTGTVTIQPRTGNGKATVVIKNARDLDGHYIQDTYRYFNINTNVPELISNLTNFPNPFSPVKSKTRIQYYLNQPAYITVELMDLSGRTVMKKEVLPNQIGGKEGFENYFDWDGKTDSGIIVQNGVYILQVTAKGTKTGEKMVLKRKIAVMK
ncbi:MAG TPA: T9SS type A sorting domain-containing protein [Firmicutes bacterium]|nr:T9SS type A sorting domain-containing protein [Bacillota bacterium]